MGRTTRHLANRVANVSNAGHDKRDDRLDGRPEVRKQSAMERLYSRSRNAQRAPFRTGKFQGLPFTVFNAIQGHPQSGLMGAIGNATQEMIGAPHQTIQPTPLGAPQQMWQQQSDVLQNSAIQQPPLGMPVQMGVPQMGASTIGAPVQFGAPQAMPPQGQIDLNQILQMPKHQILAAMQQNPSIRQSMLAVLQAIS